MAVSGVRDKLTLFSHPVHVLQQIMQRLVGDVGHLRKSA